MNDSTLHLAPNAPWPALALLSLAAIALAVWAYRFAIPPLPALAKRALPALRMLALLVLVWLLAQPVLERASGAGARLVVLADRSRSMELPVAPGGEARATAADRAIAALRAAWRGRATVEVLPFAGTLSADTGRVATRGATALGDAIAGLGALPEGRQPNGVVVVSDGAVNAGEDPVAAARALGMPVHAVIVGQGGGKDRAVGDVEASATARVGQTTPVRVHVTSTEERGTPIGVRLLEGGRELGRATVIAPGQGAEALAEFHVTPTHPGLAVWTARVDSAAGEITAENDARQVAVEVAPGRLGVLLVSPGLNWDIGFLRRALAGDSSLELSTMVRERDGWRALERPGVGLGAGALRGKAVVVLDAVTPGELGPDMDAALANFVRAGGGLLAFGGPMPGLSRYRAGRLGGDLTVTLDARAVGRTGGPVPGGEGRELLAWDDDPVRGARAWEESAPLADVVPIAPGGGDRVLLAARDGGPPLLLARRVGRGQALLVNGTGMWRWSLSGHDDLSAERGRRLWRRLVQWIAEPVQGEPLRVRPERWLSARGDRVRLFATLQDAAFQPVSGAAIEGEVQNGSGATQRVRFEPEAPGSYVATLEDAEPGRYRVTARATREGRDLGRGTSEFAVDRWSLETARTQPDSATLAAVAQASGGRSTLAAGAPAWAHSIGMGTLVRRRTDSTRLWQSPWLFGVVVGALGIEWAWRRRRGLP